MWEIFLGFAFTFPFGVATDGIGWRGRYEFRLGRPKGMRYLYRMAYDRRMLILYIFFCYCCSLQIRQFPNSSVMTSIMSNLVDHACRL